MSELSKYKVDHLLLLVGSNPVPNVVAGKLLTVPGGTISLNTTATAQADDAGKLLTAPGSTITLIHSKDGSDLAQRLGKWFRSKGYTDIRFAEVKKSNAAYVHKEVSKKIEEYKGNS